MALRQSLQSKRFKRASNFEILIVKFEVEIIKFFGFSLKLSFYQLCDLLCKPVNNNKFEK